MAEMVIDYWARFGATPLFLGLSTALFLALIILGTVAVIGRSSVDGTREAYMTTTMVQALALPVFTGYVFSTAIDMSRHDWLDAVLDGYFAFTALRDWNEYKDNDGWWKGRGTKLKKKLQSMLTSSSPATAGAGA